MLTSTAPGLWVDPKGGVFSLKTKHLRSVHAPLLQLPIPSSATGVRRCKDAAAIINSAVDTTRENGRLGQNWICTR